MQRVFLLLVTLAITLTSYTQTVENIRVVQDGENLKINYRIGASTGAQLYNVYLSCSMDGGRRFEPKAVIGDVGENIVGGRSYYEVIWDVFEDVDEVVNPEFFVRVELVSDMAAIAATETQTRTTEPSEEETPKEVEKKPEATQESPFEPSFEDDAGGTKQVDKFERNGFFAYNGSWYIPIGISFGSLNNFGYYVSFRTGFGRDYNTYWEEYDWDIDLLTVAGVTKHIVSAGFYRLHGYGGIGGHMNMVDSNTPTGHFVFDTGVVNVLGGFNLTLGLSYSFGLTYPANMVFGVGFVF